MVYWFFYWHTNNQSILLRIHEIYPTLRTEIQNKNFNELDPETLSHCCFIIFSEMMRCCANGEITTFIYNVPLAQSFIYCR